MNMTADEIVRTYKTNKTATDRRECIKALCELNLAKRSEIVDILLAAGCDVPGSARQKFSMSAKSEEPEEPEEPEEMAEPEEEPTDRPWDEPIMPPDVKVLLQRRLEEIDGAVEALLRERFNISQFMSQTGGYD